MVKLFQEFDLLFNHLDCVTSELNLTIDFDCFKLIRVYITALADLIQLTDTTELLCELILLFKLHEEVVYVKWRLCSEI